MIKSPYMKIIYMVLCVLLLFSCSLETNEDENDSSQSTEINDNSESSDESACKIENGTYEATVDYNNPETDYSNTYTLNVEVKDCQVVKIDFANGGYLDEDHISPADLDEDGNASVEGEDGKTYEVHIDK